MSWPNKICKIILLTGFIAAVEVPAFAQEHSPAEEQQLTRLKVIDAALAKTEVEFFEQPPAPEVYSFSNENSFGLTEARENIIDAALKKCSIEAGVELFFYRYEEPDFAKLMGIMQGFYTKYTYRPSFDGFLYTAVTNLYKIEGRYGKADVDYTSSGSGSDDNIPDWAVELRGILGKEYVNEPFRTVLYSGAGYRYLSDNSSGRLTDRGAYGYKRESNYYYLPAGFEFSNQMNNAWAFTVSGEYDWLIYGLQKSYLDDGRRFTGLPSDDTKNPQHQGYGLRGSVRLTRESSLVDFMLEPFVRYWNIKDSDIVAATVNGSASSGMEPANNTIEAGVKIGLQF